MAESSRKFSFSSNEKRGNIGSPNLKKMSKLFLNMNLNEETKVKEEICKIPIAESKDKEFCVAGKIISFLEKISVILVKPLQREETLLNIGSNLFSRTEENWILLGQIDEIFGNVKDPLYAVSLTPTENNLFKLDDDVYFLANHPSTSLFHVEPNIHSKYNVVYHN